MKKLRFYQIICIGMLCLNLSSCARSNCEVWDDSMTATRHMGRGLSAVGGKQGDSQMVANSEEFMGRPTRDDFVPLDDGQAFRQLTMGDTSSLDELQLAAALPQPKESPGDPGSSIPGVDAFSDPAKNRELSNIFKNIKFPYNSSLLKGPDSIATLGSIADYLKQHPDTYMFIEGHCDERGPQAYNLALGTRRANSVRNYLIHQGVALERLYTVSYGKEHPLSMGHDERAWQQNRRGQFRIYDKQG